VEAVRTSFDGPLKLDDPAPVAELRDVLLAAGFDGKAVREAFGAEGPILARPGEIPLLKRRLAELDTFGTLTALFVLGVPVPEADARRALAPLSIERVQALGLLDSGGGGVWACAQIVPHGEVLVTSDLTGVREANRPDHVAGVHNPSVTISHLTVRQPVDKALDIGTGAGIQAILASRHSGHVIATDITERALNFTAFNLVLNAAENVELRQGSYFEPVAGERAGLVVCNPPYVISPESAYLFRDSGLQGDAVSRDIVTATPTHLEEGGYATVLVSWVHRPGEDRAARLEEWLEGSGCDALLLHYGTQDPLTHIGNWTADPNADPTEMEETIDRWLGYLRGLGIESIGYGAVILRRRDAASNWARSHELPSSGLRPASEHLVRLFEAQDYLNGLGSDAELLGDRFELAPRVSVEQRVHLASGEWTIDRIEMKLGVGLGFTAGIDPLIAHLVAGLDGKRTLAELANELGEREGADRAAFAAKAVPVVRQMFEHGFLIKT
jgi:Methyltransferase small domain